MTRSAQQGFTAVEVLVTLFIAVVLLGGGYQAYSSVLKNTENGRVRSMAGNVAYEALRREAANVDSSCTVVAERNLPWLSSYTTKLPTPYSVRGSVACPYGSGSTISLLTVHVRYGASTERVTHAIYTR